MAADGAALLAAAVRAAVLAKAPRRTVQAVAAAVTGVLLRPVTAAAEPRTGPIAPPDAPGNAEDACDPAILRATLRSVRSARRQRKKQNLREAKQAALASQETLPSDSQPRAEVHHDASTAGHRAELGGVPATEPAPVLESPLGPNSPSSPRGLDLQRLPSCGAVSARHDDLSMNSGISGTLRASSSGISGTLRASVPEAASAGVQSRNRSAAAPQPPRGSGKSPARRGKK